MTPNEYLNEILTKQDELAARCRQNPRGLREALPKLAELQTQLRSLEALPVVQPRPPTGKRKNAENLLYRRSRDLSISQRRRLQPATTGQDAMTICRRSLRPFGQALRKLLVVSLPVH
jgi:hypothetical protein